MDLIQYSLQKRGERLLFFRGLFVQVSDFLLTLIMWRRRWKHGTVHCTSLFDFCTTKWYDCITYSVLVLYSTAIKRGPLELGTDAPTILDKSEIYPKDKRLQKSSCCSSFCMYVEIIIGVQYSCFSARWHSCFGATVQYMRDSTVRTETYCTVPYSLTECAPTVLYVVAPGINLSSMRWIRVYSRSHKDRSFRSRSKTIEFNFFYLWCIISVFTLYFVPTLASVLRMRLTSGVEREWVAWPRDKRGAYVIL